MQFDLEEVVVQQSGPQKMFGKALQLLFLQTGMMAKRMVEMKASWVFLRFLTPPPQQWFPFLGPGYIVNLHHYFLKLTRMEIYLI